MQEFFEIGQIVNTYGIKGFLKILPYTDDIKKFEKLKTIEINKKGTLTKYEIEEVKYSKNTVLLKLKGIDDINEAEKYRNCYIRINREDNEKLPEDTYYIVDLIGLEVVTTDGETLGKLQDIFKTGSNDVYVVKDEFGKQILLPAIESVIKEINLDQKIITVELIEGLI